MPRFPESYRSGGWKLNGSDGFTLLELLLVVTVLSAVAWMSLGYVNNNSDQVRFEDTRNRLQAIRRAIIGDTSRTINGSPEVRGYVADMGRLPAKLQELVAQDYCDDLPQYTTSGACTGGGGTWVTQNGHAYDVTTGLRAGWNGPYLPVDSLAVGEGPRFKDGWGNDSNPNSSAGNFGWTYAPDTPAGSGNVLVQSLGVDGLDDLVGETGLYALDYPPASAPPLIADNHYRIKITESNTAVAGDGTGGLRVDFGTPASCWVGICSDATYSNATDCVLNGATWTSVKPRVDIANSTDCGTANGLWQPTHDLCMAMYVVQDGALALLTSYGGISIQWDGTQKIVEFVFEDATGPTYDEDTYLYQGQMAWGIFEYEGTPTPSCQISKPFPAGSAPWKIFTYVPGATFSFERKIKP